MEWMLLPLKRYAEFSGRSRRKEYWMFVLGYLIVFMILGAIFGLLGAFSSSMAEVQAGSVNGPLMLAVVVLGILGLGILIPSIAVQVRRLHDRNMSGWWLLGIYVVSFIPVVGFIASIGLLVLLALPGTVGPNRFGPDPKDPYGKLNDVDVFA
ncbi:DUF805 domain-containing protein [Sphingomonas sp. 2R-10]|uniref:DUF805 domain-containing protein n=1 Tax=Sphingomonas sp. 2R-10 TaxID=3045148 RepID=UPI000F78CAB9|nr:DUF805 domain-containing protein [Sphingomonas sp. 2R-10]MDJ0276108.1 DUF805 domain-containing protein [Sphingomonas sp. 2R-10]